MLRRHRDEPASGATVGDRAASVPEPQNPPLSEPGLPDDASADAARNPPSVMIPARSGRLPVEGPLMRIVATAGVIGIGVAIAAIMASQHSQGWLVGLVVSIESVVLAAILWSSRRL